MISVVEGVRSRREKLLPAQLKTRESVTCLFYTHVQYIYIFVFYLTDVMRNKQRVQVH